jgi:hypothetical protein
MHMLQSLFYLTTALHDSGVTITHLQEDKTTVSTASGNLTPYCCLLLSWKGWNWFESVVGGLRHPQQTQTSSNSYTIAADSSKGVTNTRCCRYSCFVLLKMGDSDARNM